MKGERILGNMWVVVSAPWHEGEMCRAFVTYGRKVIYIGMNDTDNGLDWDNLDDVADYIVEIRDMGDRSPLFEFSEVVWSRELEEKEIRRTKFEEEIDEAKEEIEKLQAHIKALESELASLK